MKYFLIMMLYVPCPGDCGIVQGWKPQVDRQVQIEMPSLEICESIRKLNRFRSDIECWAKMAEPEK